MEATTSSSSAPIEDAQSATPAIVQVAEGLFLGARGIEFVDAASLDAHRITHLLNCTVDAPDPLSGSGDLRLASWRVPVADDIRAPLHEHLEGAAAFLNAALGAGGRVCAFCTDGRSTAPAVIAFYMMRYGQMPLAAALDALTAVAADVQPNVGFWQRLVEAESWLCGEFESDGGPAAPSVSLQQYKWRYLERLNPGVSRADILQELELGRAEIAELIRQRDEQWTTTTTGGDGDGDAQPDAHRQRIS